MYIRTHLIRKVRQLVWRWYKNNKRDWLPWRRTRDPYSIMVSEVMLQQTQVDRVIPKYQTWIATFPTVTALAQASRRDVLTHWIGLGYNNRAIRLHSTAQEILRKHNAVVPLSYEGLITLPGIGDYTARAILIFALNQSMATVDTNIRRVLIHMLGVEPHATHKQLIEVATKLLPKGRAREWHYALMDYGAMKITARSTGIASRTNQSPFLHSRRWYRSKILRSLLISPVLAFDNIVELLQKDSTFVESLLLDMEKDNIVQVEKIQGRINTITLVGT